MSSYPQHSVPNPVGGMYGQPAYSGGPAGWRPPSLDRTPAHRGYAEKPTNTLALISLLVVASGWVITGPLGTFGGAIMAFMSLKQIQRTGEEGRELAIMSLIAAAVSVVLGIFVAIGLFSMIGSML